MASTDCELLLTAAIYFFFSPSTLNHKDGQNLQEAVQSCWIKKHNSLMINKQCSKIKVGQFQQISLAGLSSSSSEVSIKNRLTEREGQINWESEDLISLSPHPLSPASWKLSFFRANWHSIRCRTEHAVPLCTLPDIYSLWEQWDKVLSNNLLPLNTNTEQSIVTLGQTRSECES